MKQPKTVPFLNKVSESVKLMAKMDQQQSGHHGGSHKQAHAVLMLVERTKQVVMQGMINPFASNNNTDLLNIATGEKASTTDLIYAYDKILAAMQATEEQGASKIEPPKLVIFASQKKVKPSKKQSLIKIDQDESAVTRALCFFQGADHETRQVVKLSFFIIINRSKA